MAGVSLLLMQLIVDINIVSVESVFSSDSDDICVFDDDNDDDDVASSS